MRTIYYKSLTDDVVESKDQHRKIPKDYVWVHTDKLWRIGSILLYQLARAFTFFYCRLFLRMRVVGRKKIRACKDEGCFLYGNHTQPIGDAFTPVKVCGKKRVYVMASPANFGVPVVGTLLPILGIIPVPDSVDDTASFMKTVDCRIGEKSCVVIYPEAHVWPYYTGVRPFGVESFHFPVADNAPVYCMTSTYQKRKFGKRPRTTVYVDGPFLAPKDLNKRKKREWLRDEVFECMKKRSQNSTYEYVRYREDKSR